MQHLTANEIAGYLDRDIPAADVRRIEVHLDMCDECRAEMVLVVRLLQEGSGDVSRPARPGTEAGRAAGWRRPAALGSFAAAAAVATLLLLQPGITGRSSDTFDAADAERVETERVGRIVTYAPADGAATAAGELRFAWADQGADSYRITITTEDGGLVWSQLLPDTTAVPPPLPALVAGGRFFWYVDAVSGGVVARSGAHGFTVVR
jgi:hypothetical protein